MKISNNKANDMKIITTNLTIQFRIFSKLNKNFNEFIKRTENTFIINASTTSA